MAKLAVIGALALDRPIMLSGPAAPGARLAGTRLAPRLGGGGANAGVALRKAGHAVVVAAALAQDAEAEAVLAAASQAGLDLAHIVRREGPTRATLILLDPAGERTVIGLDPQPAAPPVLRPPPGGLDGLFVRAAYGEAAAWAEACQGPVLVHMPCGPYAGRADVVVASADDLDAGFLAAPLASARARFPGAGWTVVTYGADGARAYGADGVIAAASPPAGVVDATGAGDIFAAGLLDALAAGASMEAALPHACAWGAAAVTLASSAPLEAPPELFPAFRPAGS